MVKFLGGSCTVFCIEISRQERVPCRWLESPMNERKWGVFLAASATMPVIILIPLILWNATEAIINRHAREVDAPRQRKNWQSRINVAISQIVSDQTTIGQALVRFFMSIATCFASNLEVTQTSCVKHFHRLIKKMKKMKKQFSKFFFKIFKIFSKIFQNFFFPETCWIYLQCRISGDLSRGDKSVRIQISRATDSSPSAYCIDFDSKVTTLKCHLRCEKLMVF